MNVRNCNEHNSEWQPSQRLPRDTLNVLQSDTTKTHTLPDDQSFARPPSSHQPSPSRLVMTERSTKINIASDDWTWCLTTQSGPQSTMATCTWMFKTVSTHGADYVDELQTTWWWRFLTRGLDVPVWKGREKTPHRQWGPTCGSSSILLHFELASVVRPN